MSRFYMSQPVNCDVTPIVCQLQFNLAEKTLWNVITGNVSMCVCACACPTEAQSARERSLCEEIEERVFHRLHSEVASSSSLSPSHFS